jgi:hypothetical protein
MSTPEELRVRERCHAGAGHGDPSDRGVYGWLCADCWASVSRILDRLLRRLMSPSRAMALKELKV